MVSTTFSPGSGCFSTLPNHLRRASTEISISSGLAVQLVVKLALDAAQALVVRSHVADHLRRQFALGIKTLRFLLEVNAAQIQRADAVCRFRVRLARHPAKSAGSFALRQQSRADRS